MVFKSQDLFFFSFFICSFLPRPCEALLSGSPPGGLAINPSARIRPCVPTKGARLGRCRSHTFRFRPEKQGKRADPGERGIVPPERREAGPRFPCPCGIFRLSYALRLRPPPPSLGSAGERFGEVPGSERVTRGGPPSPQMHPVRAKGTPPPTPPPTNYSAD